MSGNLEKCFELGKVESPILENSIQIAFGIFERDFLVGGGIVAGATVLAPSQPSRQGHHATFWHLISEGNVEDEREIKFDRLERICWPRILIEIFLSCELEPNFAEINWWRNRRGSTKRILISTTSFDYVVVLEERPSKYVLRTAYPTQNHTARKLQREFSAYWTKN